MFPKTETQFNHKHFVLYQELSIYPLMQKKLYSMARNQIDHNFRLIKPGMSFKEFVKNIQKFSVIVC